jgi:hypothetical protein
MPVTPTHVIPAATVYFLMFRRLNGLAFFFGTLLIDLEPVLYLFFNVNYPQVPLLFGGFAQQGLHMVTHSPFSVVLLVAPLMLLLTKAVELTGKGFLLRVFSRAEWINYSIKQTYFSALFGAFLHLGWDITMHQDLNLGFPFVNFTNPFVNFQAYTVIFLVSLIMILPACLIGKRLSRTSPFKKLP